MTSELVPQGAALVPTERALEEARQALVRLLDHDLAVLRLGAELGIGPLEVARRSVRISLTNLKEEGKPVTLVIAESEEHLHEVVETVRNPGVYRYKTVQRVPPQPALPEASAVQENKVGESADSSESQSSDEEAKAET